MGTLRCMDEKKKNYGNKTFYFEDEHTQDNLALFFGIVGVKWKSIDGGGGLTITGKSENDLWYVIDFLLPFSTPDSHFIRCHVWKPPQKDPTIKFGYHVNKMMITFEDDILVINGIFRDCEACNIELQGVVKR